MLNRENVFRINAFRRHSGSSALSAICITSISVTFCVFTATSRCCNHPENPSISRILQFCFFEWKTIRMGLPFIFKILSIPTSFPLRFCLFSCLFLSNFASDHLIWSAFIYKVQTSYCYSDSTYTVHLLLTVLLCW